MSNLGQFYGKGFPLGGTLNIPYESDIYTAPDGSQWYSNTPTAPFAYDESYSGLPDSMTSPHAIVNGPEANNLWISNFTQFSLAYDSANNIYCTAAYEGTTTEGFDYFVSTNGTSWTRYTFPNITLVYSVIQFTAGKFFAVATSTTANGVINSTNGVTWTPTTGVSLTPQDIISNGSNNIFIVPTSTTGAWSSDGGATWSSTSITQPSNFSLPGSGVATWNAGAGLFIMSNAAATGAYQTSPTGQTWTPRAAQPTFRKFGTKFSGTVKFASNATTTVAVGVGGFFAITTDGLTWTNHGYISNTLATSGSPQQVWYDGTRIVARFQNRVFYSTDALNWTEGKKIGGFTLLTQQSGGVLFGFPLLSGTISTKMLAVRDVSSNTRQTVISSVLHTAQNPNMTHYRIR